VTQDSQAMLWDLNEGKHLYTLDGGGETINALCFSPNRYWLCAATGPSIKIWVRALFALGFFVEVRCLENKVVIVLFAAGNNGKCTV